MADFYQFVLPVLTESDNLTSDFTDGTFIGTRSAELISTPEYQALTTNLPVETVPGPTVGLQFSNFLDDYYNAVYLTPTVFDFGAVTVEQSLPLAAWNAHLTPRQIVSIVNLPEGITISGPSVGLVLTPLQELSWTINASPVGETQVDEVVNIVFDNGEIRSIRIILQRLIAWPFPPNWRDQVTERLTWNTDILTSESTVEQRRALRLAPRRTILMDHQMIAGNRRKMDSLLYAWSGRQWLTPLWFDVQRTSQTYPIGSTTLVCTTAKRDFKAGSYAILVADDGSTHEMMQIESVDASSIIVTAPLQSRWPKGSRLCPAKRMQLQSMPSATRLTDDVSLISVEFECRDPSDWSPALPATTHRGYAVLDIKPNESRDITYSMQQAITTLDNGSAMPATAATSKRVMPAVGCRYHLIGAEAHGQWRRILYGLRGRQKAIFVPTYGNDLELISVDSAQLVIVDIGYARFINAQVGRRDLRVELNDGTILYRSILSAVSNNDGTETLDTNASLDPQTPATIKRVSYMALMRLAQDTVEIIHETDIEGSATMALSFIGVADNDVS